jgi:hypothetical protein
MYAMRGGTMNLKAFRNLIFVGVLALMFSGVGRADTIGPTCGSPDNCFGSLYTLTYDPTKTTTANGFTIYDVSLTIDTSGYNGSGQFISDVAIKVSSSVDLTNSALLAAPGGAGGWALAANNINNSGCSGVTASGWLCAHDSTLAPVPNSTPYVWEFKYATTSALFTSLLGASVQVKYNNASGTLNGQIMSNNITLQVPDGGVTLMLLGGVLVGLETLRRKLRV